MNAPIYSDQWIYSQVMLALEYCYDTLMDWRLLTSGTASLLILVVVAVFFLPLIHMWLRSHRSRNIVVEIGFLAVPLALLLLLQVPTGFVGTPDDNCMAYEKGKMNFALVDVAQVPKTRSEVYGDQWLILLVLNARWGDDVHQCRVSTSDPKVRVLAKAIHDAQQANGTGRFHHGEFTFSFGGRNEIPNVVIKGKKALVKPYPPEAPHTGVVPAPASDTGTGDGHDHDH